MKPKPIDTSAMQMQAAAVEVKKDLDGNQKFDREGRPVSVVTVVVWEDSGVPEVLRVTVPSGHVASFERGDFVELKSLAVSDWAMQGRSGVFYTAEAVEVLDR